MEVYDVLNRTQNSVKLEQGQVQGILVTGKGDIVLETNSIFLLASDSGYGFKNLDIQGNILTASGLDVVYYGDEMVQKYRIDSGGNTVLKSMPAGLELRGISKDQAIFTAENGSAAMVYNVADNNLYTYNYTYESFPGLLNWSFSPDSKHCVVLGGDSYRVIDEQGNEERIQADENMINYCCGWVNNTAFAGVIIRGETNVSAGNFAIAVYDVKAKQRKILYEQ